MFSFELGFLQLLEGIRTPFLDFVFECISAIGEDAILIGLMAILYFGFDKQLAQKVFFSTAFSLGANCIIKNIVRLPRPFADGKVSCVRPETATGYSFPSGHTQTVASWSASLALHAKKRSSFLLCIIITVLVAFSRMYLGAHYPSDVIVGAVLGFLFAALGNHLYERFTNKTLLCGTVVLLLTPFAVYYLFTPNPQYADFFKLYGLFVGFTLSMPFEKRFVAFNCDGTFSKKLLRMLLASAFAVIIKEVLKKLFMCDNLQLSLVLDAVRYFSLAFLILGICPWVFKKVNI